MKRKTTHRLAAGLCLLILGCAAMPGFAAEATITFAEDGVTADTQAVTVEGTTVTITEAGVYVLTGTCGQGQVVVDCNGEVELVLQNLNLTSANGPAVDVRDADLVALTLAEGSQNALADSAQYTGMTGEQDAAIFSRADLVLSGEGALTVRGQYNDGIASRDTLCIQDGDVTVEAKNHGVKGKDNLVIQGGTLLVTAGGDALKATNADQAAMGFVQIDGGTLALTAQDDGISAISKILINGGDISIDTANNGMKSEGDITINAGTVHIVTQDDDFVTETKTVSPEAEVTVVER